MPITKGAHKANRSSIRKRVFNTRRRRDMNEKVKEVRALISENKIQDAEQLMPQVYKAIDKASKRGIIKENTAARKKSRLIASLKKGK